MTKPSNSRIADRLATGALHTHDPVHDRGHTRLFHPMTRLSNYFLPTEKEAPADAEALSHKLMVRAGLVRQLGSRPVDLAAGRLARARERRADRARGAGRDRRAGDADAGHQPGRAVAAQRPLRHRRAVQAQGPPQRRPRARDDARGGRDHARRARRALLPRPAVQPLPLPDQGPRRAAPARRRPQHPRVHHEGRLHLRPRPRGPRRPLRALPRGLRPHLRPASGSSGTGWSPTSG